MPGSTAGGGQPRPFARAVEADGWLYVSGQVPAVDGEIITGGIIEQTRQTMRNVVAILEEAGYELKDVVRVGVWLEDPRDFWSFNKVFGEYFTGTRPGAGLCAGEHDGRLQGGDRLRGVQEKRLNAWILTSLQIQCGSGRARECGISKCICR